MRSVGNARRRARGGPDRQWTAWELAGLPGSWRAACCICALQGGLQVPVGVYRALAWRLDVLIACSAVVSPLMLAMRAWKRRSSSSSMPDAPYRRADWSMGARASPASTSLGLHGRD